MRRGVSVSSQIVSLKRRKVRPVWGIVGWRRRNLQLLRKISYINVEVKMKTETNLYFLDHRGLHNHKVRA